jgi:uncharacterized protein
MNMCPKNCPSQLVVIERNGVEIDYCPTCRGVWLDRGELDKIIERSIQPDPYAPQIPQQPMPPQQQYQQPPQQQYQQPYGKPYHGSYDDDDYRRKKKKRGFLGDIFDFD